MVLNKKIAQKLKIMNTVNGRLSSIVGKTTLQLITKDCESDCGLLAIVLNWPPGHVCPQLPPSLESPFITSNTAISTISSLDGP